MFREIPSLLPKDSLLVFNNTRVIPARWIFHKDTGAAIEIFLLHPVVPHSVEEAMQVRSEAIWHCMIGNLKRWKEGQTLLMEIPSPKGPCTLEARIHEREKGHVAFRWTPNWGDFREVVEAGAKLPLPPYLHREAEESDRERYQTVYSEAAGAVAAPTAGLHFTDEILGQISERGIPMAYTTLHVSAGTFQPVKTEDITQHPMHNEQVVVDKATVEALLSTRQVIAVGTTSMRTLESLYWYGVDLVDHPETPFFVHKMRPYQADKGVPLKQSLEAVLLRMETQGVDRLEGETEIFIIPGYKFRVCRGLITNFHQPGSTLMMLVAAFVGEDWKRIYHEALEQPYRFLSYGDSSLLIPVEEG
jgi:S-adenosylmethionine:tRNA ribosyltransferase-isomerase